MARALRHSLLWWSLIASVAGPTVPGVLLQQSERPALGATIVADSMQATHDVDDFAVRRGIVTPLIGASPPRRSAPCTTLVHRASGVAQHTRSVAAKAALAIVTRVPLYTLLRVYRV